MHKLNFKDRFLIFLVILMQTGLAISAGFFALHEFSKGRVPPRTYVENMDIGGLTREEACRELQNRYSGVFRDGSVKIAFNGRTAEIKYADIQACFDCAATVDSVYGPKGFENLLSVAARPFGAGKRPVHPVVGVNQEKLKEELRKLSVFIDVEPQNANIYFKDGNIEKMPEIEGLRLNVEKAAARLARSLGEYIGVPFESKPSNNSEIEVVKPQITLKDLEDINEIIAEYSIKLEFPELLDSARAASSAINKLMISDSGTGAGEAERVFSFNKQLAEKKAVKEDNDEGYNMVASALYAAALIAGMDSKGMARVPHKTAVDYIEPGLDVRVFGDTVDLKFINTLKHKIIIFSEVSEDGITVRIAGKKENPLARNEIKTDVVQRFIPTTINVENRDLSPGEKIIANPGKEGLKVDVYRISYENGARTKEEYLYTDVYESVKSVVYTGPEAFEEKSGGK